MPIRRTIELRNTAPGFSDTRRRIEKIGVAGERAGRRIQAGAGRASAGLRAISIAALEGQIAMGRLAATIGPPGRVRAAFGPAGIAAAPGSAC